VAEQVAQGNRPPGQFAREVQVAAYVGVEVEPALLDLLHDGSRVNTFDTEPAPNSWRTGSTGTDPGIALVEVLVGKTITRGAQWRTTNSLGRSACSK
jgi:hypothetical protein